MDFQTSAQRYTVFCTPLYILGLVMLLSLFAGVNISLYLMSPLKSENVTNANIFYTEIIAKSNMPRY